MKFYDVIEVYASQDITVCDIKLPGNNRKVKVLVKDTEEPVDVFLSYERKIVGPVTSGSRIQTPVNRFFRNIVEPVYDAKAIVVPRVTYQIPSGNSIGFDYSVKSSMMVSTTAHLLADFDGSFVLGDPGAFVEEYMKSSFSPVESIQQYIRGYIENREDYIINRLNSISDETLIANELPSISRSLTEHCIEKLRASWAKIKSLNIRIRITNMDQIIEELNRRAKTDIERDEAVFNRKMELEKLIAESSVEYKKIIISAIANVFGQSSLDPVMSQIIITYLQCNPGLTLNEMTKAFQTFNLLSQKRSATELLTCVNKILGERNNTNEISGDNRTSDKRGDVVRIY